MTLGRSDHVGEEAGFTSEVIDQQKFIQYNLMLCCMFGMCDMRKISADG